MMNRKQLIDTIMTALTAGELDRVASLAADAREAGELDVAERAEAARARGLAAVEAKRTVVAQQERAPLREGYFTVVLEDSHVTFRVERQAADAKFAPGQLIVSRLIGANNEKDYLGVAFGREDGRVNVWKKHVGDTRLVVALGVLSHDPKAAALGYAKESGRCYVCGRTLTEPSSIELGVGPVCREKGY